MMRTQPIPVAEAQLLDTCMGITCLQWEEDGDLSPADRRSILSLLCRADPEACAMLEPSQRPCARARQPDPTPELARWSG